MPSGCSPSACCYDFNADALASAEIYHPASGTWTTTGSMTTGRRHTATRLLDGRVLVAGGTDDTGVLASAEIYDPALGIWTATARMAAGGFFCSVRREGLEPPTS